MCEPTTMLIIAGTAMAASGAVSAYSSYAEGSAQKKMYDYQSDQARQEGERALKAGDLQSRLVQDQAAYEGKELSKGQARFNASQRAAMAASGVTGVTAEDITSDTFSQEKLDEMAIRYNADVKSWEVGNDAANTNWLAQSQANQLSAAGYNAKLAGKRNAFGSLLSSAASVASIASMGGGSSGGASGAGKTGGTFSGGGTTSHGIKVPQRYTPYS